MEFIWMDPLPHNQKFVKPGTETAGLGWLVRSLGSASLSQPLGGDVTF